jgi:OFA family oxalate/formate antiporter-like MFS transporter
MNRWLVVAAAVGISISIGSVYAWSVFVKPIMALLGFSLKEVQFIFSIAILFLGLSAAFLGGFVQKYGSKLSGIISSVLFGIGMVGTGFAISLKSLSLMYIFYGVIGGIGLGIGYITPVSLLIKLFPDKRGLATGFAIMGFGFGSLIAGPIAQKLIVSFGLSSTFYILGICYFILMIVSSLCFKTQTNIVNDEMKNLLKSARKSLKTKQFCSLWTMLFINITCGIAIISIASPMAQEMINMSPMGAATMVGFIGLFNGLGRIFWASISDYLGRPWTYITFFTLQVISFFCLTFVTDSIFFQLVIYLIMTCYGGGFACIPAYLSDIFGTKYISIIHGYILTAWSLAGLVGPILVALVKEWTQSYIQTLNIFVWLFLIALVISIFLKRNLKRSALIEN